MLNTVRFIVFVLVAFTLAGVVVTGSTGHADLICSGQVALEHPWGPPVAKVTIVEINACDADLTIGTPGQITVALTDQFVFQGVITADGSTEHVATVPGLGGITIIRLHKPSDDQIVMSLDFFDRAKQRYGGFSRAHLHCQPLAG